MTEQVATTDEMVDRSRGIAKSDAVWDLDKGHTAQFPRLRRLSSMNDHHPTYWEYASGKNSPLPDAIADLVGPDVKFHHMITVALDNLGEISNVIDDQGGPTTTGKPRVEPKVNQFP